MSRRCTEVQEELAGQLAEEVAGSVLSARPPGHLEECPNCSREAERLRGLLTSLGAAQAPDPGEEYWLTFLPRLRNRLAAEGVTRGRRPPVSWVWSLAASAASFLLVGVAVGRWGAPAEVRASFRLEQAAVRSDPELLQRALDTLFPGSHSGMEAAAGAEVPTLAADLERALDEIFPEDEADVFRRTRELTPEQRHRLAQALGADWV